jgi:hypothetical protein
VFETLMHRRGYLHGISDIQSKRQDVVAESANEVVERLGLAGGGYYLISSFERCFGPESAKSSRRSRDEPNLMLCHTSSILH